MKIKIDEIKTNHPFKVEERYFEELSNNIDKKITVERNRQKGSAVINYPLFALVTAIVLIALSFVFYINTSTSISNNDLLAEISEEEIIQYLDNIDLSEDELISMIDTKRLDEEQILLESLEIELNDEELINDFFGLTDQI